MLPGDKKIMSDFIKERINALKSELETVKSVDMANVTEYDKMKNEAKIVSIQTEINYYLSRLDNLEEIYGEDQTAPKM